MAITGIGNYSGVYQNTYGSQKADLPAKSKENDRSFAKTDTVEISNEAKTALQQNGEPESEEKATEEESTRNRGMVGINVGKLARRLAAAKTRSQVQAVIAQIRSDLQECDSGKAQGMDVDEASYAAAQRLLQQAQQQLGQAENREPTPEEEMASTLASLM